MDKNPNKESATRLYDAIQKQNVDIGDFDTFFNKLKADDGSQRLVDVLAKNNIDIGTLDEVNSKLYGGTTPDLKKKGSTVSPVGGGSSDLLSVKFGGEDYEVNPTTQQVFKGGKPVTVPQNIKDYIEKNIIGSKPKDKPAEQPKPYTTSQVAVELKKKVELNPALKGVAKIYKDYNAANKNLLNAQMDLTAGLQGEKDVIQTDVLGKPVAIQGSITEQKIKGLKENVDLAKANKQAAKENLIKVSPAFKDKNIDIVSELQKDNIDVEETVIPQAVEKIKFVEDISDLEDNLKANGQTLDDWSKYVDTEAPKEFLDDKQRALFDVIKTGDEAKIKTATDVYYKDIDDQISQIDKDITALSVGKFNTAVDVPQRVADLKKQKQDLIDSKAGALQPEAALKKVAAIASSFDVVDKMLKDIPPTQRAKLLFDKLYADKIKEQAKFGKDMSDTKAMGTGFRAVTERNKLRDIDQALNILAPIVFLNQKPDMQQSGWTRFGRGVWNSMVGDATGVTLPKKEDIGNKVTSLMAQATVDENITPQLRESIKKTTPDITDQAIDMGAYITSILPSYGAMGAVAKGARLPALFRIGFNNVGKYAPLVGRIAPQLTRMTTEGVTSKLTGLAMDDQDELTFWGRFGGQGFTELIDKSPFGKLVSKAIGKMGVKETPAFLKVLGRVHKQGVGETGSESIEEAYTIYQNSDTFEDFKKNIKRFVDNPSEGLLFLGGTYLMGAGLGGVSPNISKKFYTAADKAYNDLPPNEQAAFDNFVKDVNQGQEDAVMEVVLKTVDKVPNKVVDGLVTDLNTAVEELGKTEVGEDGYEVKVGDTVYQGNTAQDLQNDIDDAQSLLAIYKGEQDNRKQNGITIEETETPPIAEADQGDVELAKPEAGVGVETGVVETDITVGEMLDKSGTYKGEKGRFYQDGQAVIFSVDGSNKEYELGNVDEISATPIADFDITHETSVVDIDENGTITVRGKKYQNNFSDPTAAINRDSEGNVISVNLETTDGKKRTFKGNVAEDLAYQIHLQEISKDNETKEQFEQYINDTPDVKQQIDDGGLSEVAPQNAATDNAEVQREKITPIVVAEAPTIQKPTTQIIDETTESPTTATVDTGTVENAPTETAIPTEQIENIADKAGIAPKKAKKAAIQSDVIDKLVGNAANRREAYKEIADENIKEVAKIITDTNGKFDKVMDAIDNNDQLLADLEKKLGIKKICRI